MSTHLFTVQERSALLRAARKVMDETTLEIIRLHTIDGLALQQGFNRALADAHSDELQYLASAIRKLWMASGEHR